MTERPFLTPAPQSTALTGEVVDQAIGELERSGYLVTPPVVPEARMAPLRHAMDTLVAHGIPAGFACVYDEYYQCFQGLERLFVPLLGAQYRWVAHGYWAFRVVPGDGGESGLFSGSPPHRDSLGPDPRVIAGEHPGIMTVWLALTDVTTVDSCIYVVPKYADKAFATRARDVNLTQFGFQDILAVPVRAGSLMAWSTHLIHWGSRSAPSATEPRMSITMYFQRADIPPCDPSTFDEGGRVPLADRLRWIIQSMGLEDQWPKFFPEV